MTVPRSNSFIEPPRPPTGVRSTYYDPVCKSLTFSFSNAPPRRLRIPRGSPNSVGPPRRTRPRRPLSYPRRGSRSRSRTGSFDTDSSTSSHGGQGAGASASVAGTAGTGGGGADDDSSSNESSNSTLASMLLPKAEMIGRNRKGPAGATGSGPPRRPPTSLPHLASPKLPGPPLHRLPEPDYHIGEYAFVQNLFSTYASCVDDNKMSRERRPALRLSPIAERSLQNVCAYNVPYFCAFVIILPMYNPLLAFRQL